MNSLKTEYKHLVFGKVGRKGTTSVWECKNRDGLLMGSVEWYGPWRQYCFTEYINGIYSAGCLNDIAEFMRTLRAHELAARKAADKDRA